jgi:hypothetical protein
MQGLDMERDVVPFSKVEFNTMDNGYIVWRRATGNNVELLHIRTYVPGKGTGRLLIQSMLRELQKNPPYATVFGMTRVSNHRAKSFYTGMGFTLSKVNGIYADGEAIVFSQSYSKLMEIHGVD